MKDHERHETNTIVKYQNKSFELLIPKKKDGTLSDSCVVVDKRNQHIVYNDIDVALQKIK